jgi:hypothetical protein
MSISNGIVFSPLKKEEYKNSSNQINNYSLNINNNFQNTFNNQDYLKKKFQNIYNSDNKNNLKNRKNYANYEKKNFNHNNLDIKTDESNYSNLFTNESKSRKQSNLSSMDNIFKKHIGLQSVMKRDFINNNNCNIRIETSESIIPKGILDAHKGSPFIGRSTNSIMFQNFEISPNTKNKDNSINKVFLKIPFSGISSYKENYNKFEDRYYIDKITPILKKDNLENFGKRIMETTNKASYKNIKFNYKNFSKDKNSYKQLYSIANLGINPPQNKDIYMSHYRREFIYDTENTRVNTNQ